MQVRNVMTRNVISVKADDSIMTAAQLMLENRISGLPVVDADGAIIGIVTEGDFLHRRELGTTRQRPKWLQFIVGPGRLATEYVQSAGRKVGDVMTPEPYTIGENASLDEVVELMERHRIKRLPVMRDGKVVGIISRANLLHALASIAPAAAPVSDDDAAIRDRVLAALSKHNWAFAVNVVVKNGVVDLWGTITDERVREACIVAVENVADVKKVHDHLVWVEPMSGMAFPSSEDQAREDAERS